MSTQLYTGDSTFSADDIQYGISIGRRQPMHRMHVDCIKEITDAGLTPIIIVGSTNPPGSKSYDPLRNPLTFAEQQEQIRLALPSLKDPVIIPFDDLGNLSRWSKAVGNLLSDPFKLRLHGLDVTEPILPHSVMHYRSKSADALQDKQIIKSLDSSQKALAEEGLSSWKTFNANPADDDLSATKYRRMPVSEFKNHADELAAPDYIAKLALDARAANPDRKMLDEAGVPVTMLDLTLMRIYRETGTRPAHLLKTTGQECTQDGLEGACKTFIRHNSLIQEGKHPLSLDKYLKHASEHYKPEGNSVMEFLFHPATLLAIQSLTPSILEDLVPQGGFEHFIPELKKYNERMAKSMADKVDYLDALEAAQIVIDFGCANGAMLKYMQSTNPGRHYIGYDISQPMIDLANTDNAGNITFTTDWNLVLEEARRVAQERGTENVLVLSSLLHEVYSYLPPQEVEKFWDKVWHSDFDYIAVRDMMVSETIDRQSKPEDVAKIRANYDTAKIDEWEQRWGPLEDNRSMVHFLLTCPYKENWVRELQENYLPISLQDFIKSVPPEYEIKMMEHYALPYFKDRTSKEFDGLEVGDNTHFKIVLQKATRLVEDVQAEKQRVLDHLNAAKPGTEISGQLIAEGLMMTNRNR